LKKSKREREREREREESSHQSRFFVVSSLRQRSHHPFLLSFFRRKMASTEFGFGRDEDEDEEDVWANVDAR
jgi:hypothetical protein